jgi:(p)ppGpp synthase/HD superfamily hydrolase
MGNSRNFVGRDYVSKMNESDLLEKAISLAVTAHRGQRDRYGAPYILHPLRVMSRVHSVTEKIIAILHDVVEDTEWTFEELKRDGFPDSVLAALDCLTKREEEDYEEFVKRSESNVLARSIKLADLEDNMDLRRLSAVTEQDKQRLEKYVKAWRKLSNRS